MYIKVKDVYSGESSSICDSSPHYWESTANKVQISVVHAGLMGQRNISFDLQYKGLYDAPDLCCACWIDGPTQHQF